MLKVMKKIKAFMVSLLCLGSFLPAETLEEYVNLEKPLLHYRWVFDRTIIQPSDIEKLEDYERSMFYSVYDSTAFEWPQSGYFLVYEDFDVSVYQERIFAFSNDKNDSLWIFYVPGTPEDAYEIAPVRSCVLKYLRQNSYLKKRCSMYFAFQAKIKRQVDSFLFNKRYSLMSDKSIIRIWYKKNGTFLYYMSFGDISSYEEIGKTDWLQEYQTLYESLIEIFSKMQQSQCHWNTLIPDSEMLLRRMYSTRMRCPGL